MTQLVQRQGQVVALQLGDLQLDVEQLVLCAGHRGPGLALPGVQIPVYPLKGYSLTAPISAGHLPRR